MLLKIVPVKIKTIRGSLSMMLFGELWLQNINMMKNAKNGHIGLIASDGDLILPVLSLYDLKIIIIKQPNQICVNKYNYL